MRGTRAPTPSSLSHEERLFLLLSPSHLTRRRPTLPSHCLFLALPLPALPTFPPPASLAVLSPPCAFFLFLPPSQCHSLPLLGSVSSLARHLTVLRLHNHSPLSLNTLPLPPPSHHLPFLTSLSPYAVCLSLPSRLCLRLKPSA
ncbi:hypothetical protein EDB86DRAFT_3082025 [Lactarius hatsudake]|nr:hypothetical protein EDB86DRAFT_3082025 [Lactarius hatsudake]